MDTGTTIRDVTVLVVDDQPLFLKVAATVVERTNGFRLIGQASNGVTAIELVESLRPELVLMDIHMPTMDGIEAARRITAASPSAVVVLLSSYAKTDLPAEVAGSGAADYLHKEELAPTSLASLWDIHGAR